MGYLDILARRGILGSIQPNGNLRLDPKFLITKEIRTMVRDHKEELLEEIMEHALPHELGEEILPARRIVWVAPDLNWFDGVDPRIGYETLEHPYNGITPGVCYRQLDPTYYAWMDYAVKKALQAYNSHHLDKDTYHRMRWNLNPVEEQAFRLFGEDVCGKATRTFSPGLYVPPSEETYAVYRKAVDVAYTEYQRMRK